MSVCCTLSQVIQFVSFLRVEIKVFFTAVQSLLDPRLVCIVCATLIPILELGWHKRNTLYSELWDRFRWGPYPILINMSFISFHCTKLGAFSTNWTILYLSLSISYCCRTPIMPNRETYHRGGGSFSAQLDKHVSFILIIIIHFFLVDNVGKVHPYSRARGSCFKKRSTTVHSTGISLLLSSSVFIYNNIYDRKLPHSVIFSEVLY